MLRTEGDPTLPTVPVYLTQRAYEAAYESGITGAITANPTTVRKILGPVSEVSIVLRSGWLDRRFARDEDTVYINGDHMAYPTYTTRADIAVTSVVEMTTSFFDSETLEDAFVRAVAGQKLRKLRQETTVASALFLGGALGAAALAEQAPDQGGVWLASGVCLMAALYGMYEHSCIATDVLQRRPVV